MALRVGISAQLSAGFPPGLRTTKRLCCAPRRPVTAQQLYHSSSARHTQGPTATRKESGATLDSVPELVQQWDSAKNGNQTPFDVSLEQWDTNNKDGQKPEEVSLFSNNRVQWICNKHEQPFTWAATIYSRTREHGPTGCPACGLASKQKTRTRQPSLTEGSPQLVKQWHPTLNDKSPAEVTCGSVRKVWWLCQDAQCGHQHVWQATVLARVREGSRCPICAGVKPCVCNNLAVQHPEVVQQQWDFERNEVKPEHLLPQSNKKVHWRCNLHQPPHTWMTAPKVRFSGSGSGCPLCGRERQRRAVSSS